jgi:hypothetical protein
MWLKAARQFGNSIAVKGADSGNARKYSGKDLDTFAV